VVSVQFCQTTFFLFVSVCIQPVFHLSVYYGIFIVFFSNAIVLVVNVQFCQATCGQRCWVNKGTDTHSGYAKFIAFPEQQFVRICPSVLRYTYITLPVFFKTVSKNAVLWESVMGQNRVSLPSNASVSNILR